MVIAAVQFNSLYSELKFCTDSILCSLSEFCNDNIWQEWSWLEVKLKTMSLVNHITKTILYHIIIIRLQPMTATSLINFWCKGRTGTGNQLRIVEAFRPLLFIVSSFIFNFCITFKQKCKVQIRERKKFNFFSRKLEKRFISVIYI